MTDSSQASQTTTTIPLIDLETDAIRRDYNDELFEKKFIYIPAYYYTRLAKTGLLNQFVNLIECEATINDHIKQLLNKYHIHIPADYYARMTETNLFQSLLKIVHHVNRKQEVSRIKNLKRTSNQRYKSRYDDISDDDDDDDNNKNNNNNSGTTSNNEGDNDQQQKKRQKTGQYDTSTSINTAHSPYLTIPLEDQHEAHSDDESDH